MPTLSILLIVLRSLAPQQAERDVAVEEYLELQRPTAVAAAPDGSAAVIAVRTADVAANRFFSALYFWRAGRGVERIGPRFDSLAAPRWSRTGEQISFHAGDSLSVGEAGTDSLTTQLWAIGASSSGPARQLTRFAGGIVDHAWAAGDTIFALAREQPDSAPDIWRVSAADGSVERIRGGDPGIREMSVSPNGRLLAYSTNRTGSADDVFNFDLNILDLESNRVRRLTDRAGSEVGPVWTADGNAVVFRAPSDPTHPAGQTALFRVGASGGRLEELTDAFDRSVLDHGSRGDEIVFAAAMGVRTHLFTVRANGAIQPLAGGESSYGAFAVGAGTLFAIGESAVEPPELWRLGGAGPERLTDLNARTRQWRLGRQVVVAWRAPDGLAIEGILVYPAGYEDGRRYPLLVVPAGGPGRRANDVLIESDGHQLFAAAGYAVLAPNFRGSIGYGRDFATLRRSDLAGGDRVDMAAGIDHVVAMGLADSARIGIVGSGYAGELAGWVLTQSPRFAAAVIGHGIGGLVYPAAARGPQVTWQNLMQDTRDGARRIQTPLLLATVSGVGGGESARHARALHQSLRDLGKRAELVELSGDVTPGPQGRAELFLRQRRWLDRHLKPGGADLFEFYLAGESVPGPGGWYLRASGIETVAGYAAVQPDSGRYLEVTLSFQPEESRGRERLIPGFQLDPASGVQLLGADGSPRPLAGTVTQLFDEPTLVLGMPAAFVVPEARRGSPPTVSLRLAFHVADESGTYWLTVQGFPPIRIWIPAASGAREADS